MCSLQHFLKIEEKVEESSSDILLIIKRNRAESSGLPFVVSLVNLAFPLRSFTHLGYSISYKLYWWNVCSILFQLSFAIMTCTRSSTRMSSIWTAADQISIISQLMWHRIYMSRIYIWKKLSLFLDTMWFSPNECTFCEPVKLLFSFWGIRCVGGKANLWWRQKESYKYSETNERESRAMIAFFN